MKGVKGINCRGMAANQMFGVITLFHLKMFIIMLYT